LLTVNGESYECPEEEINKTEQTLAQEAVGYRPASTIGGNTDVSDPIIDNHVAE
jgi:hypothetical protein